MTFQQAEAQARPEIDKNSISVHPVRRGNMPVRLMPVGQIASLTPPEVWVTVPTGTAPAPQVGQMASVQVKAPEVMVGSVVDIDRATLKIRLNEPFPPEAVVGTQAGALIEVGELKDVVYFERPESAQPNTEVPLFVLEPGGEFAHRATVRFGRQSGALIQVLSGLSLGDLVIVTDTTPWNGYERVRIN